MRPKIDIPYLNALFAELAITHAEIVQPDPTECPFEYATRVSKLPREDVVELLHKIGFHDILVAPKPRDGSYFVSFIALPRGER